MEQCLINTTVGQTCWNTSQTAGKSPDKETTMGILMNPSRVGWLPCTYIATTIFVCKSCISKWCTMTITLGTIKSNKLLSDYVRYCLQDGADCFLNAVQSWVWVPKSSTSDPATNVICIRQAKKQLNNPNRDLAVPDATTAWKEARAAQLHLWDMIRSMCLLNTTVKCMPASCYCSNWDNTHILAISLRK